MQRLNIEGKPMNKEYILEVRRDRELGELGLMIQGTPEINYPMVALEGLLVAHDLIEHVNGHESIGSIDDELEALGGVWNTRGQHGEIRRGSFNIYSPEENIASDVANLGELWYNGVNFRTPVPRTRETGETEDWLTTIIEYGIKNLKSELKCQGETIDYDRINEYAKAATHYIRQGYRKHVKKWGSRYEASNMFWNIAEAVEPLIKQIEYEGQEFKLTITDNGVYCDEHYEYDEYDEVI